MGLLACNFCRSRKIACDRKQPACSRCLLAGRACEYRARKSSKLAVHSRIKAFENRLGTLESRLIQEQSELRAANGPSGVKGESKVSETARTKDGDFTDLGNSAEERDLENESCRAAGLHRLYSLPEIPLQRTLYHLYFQQVHPIAPMIHKRKFSKALEGDPGRAPPLALRYAMWATAALTRTEHQHLAEDLYVTARKETEQLEVKSTLAVMAPSLAQCWFLIASFEASRAYFTRAWMSVGRCARAAQMMQLHRLDSPYDEFNILEQASWIDREEARRVFWAAYCADKWASTLSGHPLIIRDEDVSFLKSSMFREFLRAGSISATSLLGKCLNHLRTFEHGLTPESMSRYWESHRQIDTCVSLIFMNLPSQLRVQKVERDVNVVFTHFNLHLSVILLHQLAMRTASKQGIDEAVVQNSFQRCLTSAVEIKDTMYSVRDLRNFPVSKSGDELVLPEVLFI